MTTRCHCSKFMFLVLAGKFARDLNGDRMNVDFPPPAIPPIPVIPKSFVTSRREGSMLPGIIYINVLRQCRINIRFIVGNSIYTPV